MKTDKKTRAVMTDRMKWLKGWLKARNYDIGDKRKDFIFFYYCTLRVLYSPQLARKVTLIMNGGFTQPLDEYAVKSIIKTVNAKNGYNQRNSTIIDTLGITPEEVQALRIGHNLIEKAARTQRQLERLAQEELIIQLYQEGMRIVDIAAAFPTLSKRTIERTVQSYAKEKKQERNQQIRLLAENGMPVSAIAKTIGCSIPTVRSVLNKKKPTDMTITESLRGKVDAPSFIDRCGYELFSLYKRESAQAVPEDYDKALSELKATRRNVRIVGAGGTGKTNLINDYLRELPPSERSGTLVVAPTGLAASHIDGITVHKAFGLLNEVQTKETPITIPQSLINLQRVIIDEVSMLRIDIFDRIIAILQQIEDQQNRQIQIIVLGDFGQLEPVCTKEDRKQIHAMYPAAKGIYAFYSEKWDKLNFQLIPLKYNFRQDDLELSNQLAALKYGSLDAIRWFNSNSSFFTDDRAVYICPKNEDVEKYNKIAMQQFKDEQITVFKAKSKDLAPNTELPCPAVLQLAEGMRIMTIVNDRKYKNGSIGSILQINRKSLKVLFDNGTIATVHRKKFTLQDGNDYEQLPIVLAYAFTVHKCQGCTFDSIVVVPGFFAAGQLYTALSRCRTIDGICLEVFLTEKDLIIDTDALRMTV